MLEFVIRDRLWEISKADLCKMYNDASDKSVIVSVRVGPPCDAHLEKLLDLPVR